MMYLCGDGYGPPRDEKARVSMFARQVERAAKARARHELAKNHPDEFADLVAVELRNAYEGRAR